MAQKYYRFSIVHHGFSIELRVNDVVIDSDPAGMFRNRAFINNLFIVNGKNTVTLSISLAGDPPQMPADLTLSCMVHELTEDQLDGKNLPPPLALLEFPGKEVPSFPATLTAEFDVDSPFDRWFWEDAERVDEVMPDDVVACADVAKSLHGALEQKDLQKLLPHLEIKTKEIAHAFYIDPTQRAQDQQEFFKEVFNDPQFGMEPLNTEDLEIVPMGNNRVFLLRKSDGAIALESKELSAGYCFSLPIYLSKANGEWRVIR